MERDGVYAGYIPVDENVYEGDYTLAAYTAYSENQGQDYFFRKPIKILAPQSSRYLIESEFSSTGDDEVKGRFKLKAIDRAPINYKVMSWTMPDGKTLEMAHAKNGFSRKFNRNKDENAVLVKFGDYGRYINVEYPANSIEISFYPEGGWLIGDQPCTVAFKATDENGKGVQASGIIKTGSGEEIAEFHTVHNGMGSVTFVPEYGESYIAYYTEPDGTSRSVQIGSPKEGAAALRYVSSGSKGIFSVAGGEDRELELVVALRGAGMLSAPISANTPLSFDKAEMPVGLYQAFLVSKSDNAVISERIFFIGADRKAPEISALSKDSTTILLQMPKGFTADCTVRITNGKIPFSNDGFDLRTQLMLQSELRGRIENPSYYFKNNDRETEKNLDLLMMVNGWSRYNFPEAIQGKYEEPLLPLEIGQEIAGQVRSRWKNSPIEGVLVNAIAPKNKFGTFAETDSDGVFRLNGFDLPEGTSFIVKAMNEKGGLETNYEIFEEQYPEIEILKNDIPVRTSDEIAEFFKNSRWILLDEVKVQAFKSSNDDIYANFASFSRSADDMKVRGITSIEQALRGIGGIANVMDHLKWRNSEVIYYIDGNLFDPQGLASLLYDVGGFSYGRPFAQAGQSRGGTTLYSPTLSEVATAVPFNSIERIDFIRPEHSLVLGPSYGRAAVLITTKSGNQVNWERQFELKDYLPLGYQKYKEYASPILSVDSDEYDLQTHPTLLWLPSVKFDDSGKVIDLKFPVRSDYRLVIEGLADDGGIIFESY
ncbi:MAG: carboxypeptidase-like regulatory domain-containing protein [Muribaculaceae bacterium]|nr:carboxypeptidase-like regulatory domain-containing protein [Muribaculaceae bacterium]